jgi:hypothetical protein
MGENLDGPYKRFKNAKNKLAKRKTGIFNRE